MSAASNDDHGRLTSAEAAVGAPLGRSKSRSSRLWLWFVVAFLVQAAAWTAWFVIASQHPVQEVPLVPTAR